MWQRIGRVSVQTTADILAVHGPMPPIAVARVVRQLAIALAKAHDARVVHGAIKPATATGPAPDDTSRLYVMRNARR